MKILARSLVFIMLILSISCSRDRSDDDQNNDQPTGLAAFLNGRFDVQAIDFSGSVTAPGGLTSPLDSAGNGGSGFYEFNSANKRVVYDVTGQVKFTILTQSINLPVPVQGEGTYEVISETRFTITPDDGAPQVCDVVEASGNSLIFTTRSEQDTNGFNFNTTLELFLEKK